MSSSENSLHSASRSALLAGWHSRFRKSEKAHYGSATTCRWWNYGLGIPLVIMTVFVASETFAQLEAIAGGVESLPEADAVFVIAIVIVTPVLAALQTFLRFPERAEKHRSAAVRFGGLKGEVEELVTLTPSDAKLTETIRDMRERDTQIRLDAPSAGTLSLIWAARSVSKRRSVIYEDDALVMAPPT